MGGASTTVTLTIPTVIAIPKFLMIAAIFMHLYGDEDSGILTLTALFPAFHHHHGPVHRPHPPRFRDRPAGVVQAGNWGL